jgi:surface polysaccharide O-acyltransferase-like enzyme
MNETKRQTELDVLRLIATLAVIMIHAGLKISTDSTGVQRMYWGIHAAIVWCVPAFFMVSGRFFLDPARDVSIKKIFSKYIPHLVIPFLVWTAVFTAYYIVSGTYDNLNVFGIATEFIHGPYHLWFLYALAGLYLLTPLLRKISADDKLMTYFLILFGIINIVLEYLVYLPKVGGIIETFIENLGLQVLSGYAGYFMLGYYLYSKRESISGKKEIAAYIIGALMFVGTIAAECLATQEMRETDFIKQYLKPNVIIYSAAIYLFFIKRVSLLRFSEKAKRILAKLTEYGFGVYCIHAIINEFIQTPSFESLPIITSLLRVVCLYLISLALTWLIRKIPFVGKKIT